MQAVDSDFNIFTALAKLFWREFWFQYLFTDVRGSEDDDEEEEEEEPASYGFKCSDMYLCETNYSGT